jgi:hypothetical protein
MKKSAGRSKNKKIAAKTSWWRSTAAKAWSVLLAILTVVGAFALWPSVDVTVSDIRNPSDSLSVDFTVTNSNPYTIEHVMADVNPRKLGSFDPRLRMFPTTWDHDKTLERHGSLSLP